MSPWNILGFTKRSAKLELIGSEMIYFSSAPLQYSFLLRVRLRSSAQSARRSFGVSTALG